MARAHAVALAGGGPDPGTTPGFVCDCGILLPAPVLGCLWSIMVERMVSARSYGCLAETFGPNWNRCCFLRPSDRNKTNIIYIFDMFSLGYKCSRVVGQHEQLKREGNKQEKEKQGVGHNHPRR